MLRAEYPKSCSYTAIISALEVRDRVLHGWIVRESVDSPWVVHSQGCFSIDLSDLENVSQQLRHRGNATWMHHARYGLSIVEALSHNVMGMWGVGYLGYPSALTCNAEPLSRVSQDVVHA